MNIEIGIIGVLSAIILGWLSFYLNSKRYTKKETKEDMRDQFAQDKKLVKLETMLETKLTTIEQNSVDTKYEVKELNKNITDINTRLILVERSVDKAHERIDTIKEEKK